MTTEMPRLFHETGIRLDAAFARTWLRSCVVRLIGRVSVVAFFLAAGWVDVRHFQEFGKCGLAAAAWICGQNIGAAVCECFDIRAAIRIMKGNRS